MSWNTRPSEPAGHKVSAAEMKAILDQIDSLTAPGWTDYSSTIAWTSSGTAPAFGNATKVAEYRQSAGSDLITVRLKITFGTTSTYGTGVYFFSLPVTAGTNEFDMPAGTAWALDSGSKEAAGIVKIESAGDKIRISPTAFAATAGSFNNWGTTEPFTWGTNDVVKAQFTYSTA